MILRVFRIESDSYGNFGILYTQDYQPVVTCEPPWIEWSDGGRAHHPYGKPFESCVPVGRYGLVWHHSAKYGPSWHLEGEGVHVTPANLVGHRYSCLLHPANYPDQLQGCLSLGKHLGMVGGRYGVASSRYALQQFNSWLPTDQRHQLLIANA